MLIDRDGGIVRPSDVCGPFALSSSARRPELQAVTCVMSGHSDGAKFLSSAKFNGERVDELVFKQGEQGELEK